MTDPTEALVRKEVTRARKILAEDRMMGKLNRAHPDEPPPDDGDPKPPPKTDPKDQPSRKGLWWGQDVAD